MTENEILLSIKELVENVNGYADAEEVSAYCDKKIEQLANKRQKDLERAAKKRAEGDELQNDILNALTSDWQTADEIAAIVGVKRGKIPSRMKNLIENGQAKKDNIKREGEDKAHVCYAVAE